MLTHRTLLLLSVTVCWCCGTAAWSRETDAFAGADTNHDGVGTPRIAPVDA